VRIGVNALYLIPGGVGGTETYLRGLLQALAEIDQENRYYVFTNRETGADVAPTRPNIEILQQPVRAVVRPARIVWEQAALPLQATRLRLDVLLNPGFTAPLAAGCPQATVFHDLQHKRHPEYFRWFDLPFWQFLLYWSAQISTLLLADSDATAADLRRYYRIREAKIRVAPLGVDEAFFGIAARRRPERFLLCPSTLHPHKNLEALLEAFVAVRQARPEFRLVVTGVHGFATKAVHELRDHLGLREAVEFPGWLPREELHELFARAWGLIYPSLFEGFGLPLLESMAAGVPTACSAIEPLAGNAGDAALLFDPHDGGAIADAMLRLVDDDALRERLSAAGPRRAAEFAWQRTARRTLAALVEAAGLA
jgi:glycosyltransferase involved in cell wall biosynthesis